MTNGPISSLHRSDPDAAAARRPRPEQLTQDEIEFDVRRGRMIRSVFVAEMTRNICHRLVRRLTRRVPVRPWRIPVHSRAG